MMAPAPPEMMAQLAGGQQPVDPLQMMLAEFAKQQAQIADGPDPNNAAELSITPSLLGQAVKNSWERMSGFRDVRVETLEKYGGRHYGDGNTDQKGYVNLLNQAVETLISQLVAFEPKAHVEPIESGLLIEALIRELSLNRAAKRVQLGEVHYTWVLEALFAPFGIVRTGLKAGQEQVSVGNKSFNRGEFFAENIDFEDYVIDQSARRPGDRLYEGHRLRVPRDVALAAEREPGVPLYDHSVIKAAPRLTTGKTEQSMADTLAGQHGDPFELVDMIELWEIAVYLGDKTTIYTLSDLSGGSRWAREPYEFWGPETGPYVKLWFMPMPSSALPIAYTARQLDLHDMGCEITERYYEGIRDTKTQHIYRPGEEDLADAMRKGGDNEWIKGDPSAVNTVKSGGLTKELQPGVEFLMQQFNNASGSSQLMGGHADIAKTATAATILQGNAQARIQVMTGRSLRGLSTIFEHMAWYQDNDPALKETLVARLPGGARTEFVNTPELRKGDYTQFIFSVDAYSAKPMDPAVRLDKLLMGIQALISSMPLGPQGFSKVAQILSKELQCPELDEINPDPSMMMARQAVGAAEGGQPKDNPLMSPETNVAPRPYQQSLNQGSSTRSANGPGASAA